MSSLNGLSRAEVVDSIREGCNPGWCLLREIILMTGGDHPIGEISCQNGNCFLRGEFIEGRFSNRGEQSGKFSNYALSQAYCVATYKLWRSRTLGRDLGWNEAWEEWKTQGHAENFRAIYDSSKTPKQIYESLINQRFVVAWR